MANFEDLTGRKFNRLTVIDRASDIVEKNGRKRAAWNCVCDCGAKVIVRGYNLKKGNIKSCGCYKADRNRNYFTKHGCAGDRLYKVWQDIKKRCYNPNYKQFKDYGGRGIKMCDEWLNDFTAFRDFALSNGYSYTAKFGETTIDRINPNGNYEPSNCRFVSMQVQNKNKRGALNG